MARPRIYCDYNATAPLRPKAREAMLDALERWGNPSSVHAEGRRARGVVEAARERVAAAIGACRDDIAFTGGGTEAAQAPLLGALKADPALRLIISPIEHDCLAALPADPASRLWTMRPDGVVDLEGLKAALSDVAEAGHRPLVSLMRVNNETGVIQPVAEAAALVHAAGGLIHTDAAQAVGRTDTSILDLDPDYLSLSGHKLGGPQGVGAFYVRPGAPYWAVQAGGGQEFGRRAGTESVAVIAGFGAAIAAAMRDRPAYEALQAPRDAFEARLSAAVPTLAIHGRTAPRIGGVSCFGVEGWVSETQIMNLDLAGFALSAGAACSSGKVRPSRVLTAMGLSEISARSSVRASFGWASRPEDFDRLADAWLAALRRARPELLNKESADA